MNITSATLLVLTISLIGIYGNTTGWVRYTTLLLASILIGLNWR
jgi:hypothetical protein